MRIVVGLGNPGKEYARTRHNAGWLALDKAAALWPGEPISWKMEKKWNAEVAKLGRDVLLVKPQTFMNRSGESVGALLHFYKAKPDQLLVVHDELDLPLGTLRLVRNRGAAGHHGVESVAAVLGTKDFSRLRIGVAPAVKNKEGADLVLDGFSRSEAALLTPTLQAAAEQILAWISTHGTGPDSLPPPKRRRLPAPLASNS